MLILGNLGLAGFALLAITMELLPSIYVIMSGLITSILFSGSLFFDRKGMGAKATFAITHNAKEIGVSFRNLSESWDTPQVHQFAVPSIEEILFDSKRSKILFLLEGKQRSFTVCSDIPKEVVGQMLTIATKDSGTPFRILR